MDPMLQRAALLLRQHKYKEAEAILGRLMTERPDDVEVMAFYVDALIIMDQHEKAMKLVHTAMGLRPDFGHLYYQRARIRMHNQEPYEGIEQDLEQAIALDPLEADYFAMYALVKMDRKQFAKAQELAESALEVDPENIMALNARSMALLKQGRKEESFDTIEGAFRHDPQNAFTHANHGWGLLEKGSAREALHHFSEALRIDPNMELAQSGMLEALKARYFLYRIFMKFNFWLGNLTAKYQWGVLIGLYLAIRGLRSVIASYPSAEPFAFPVLILLLVFAFSTWIITPVSNLFLRLNRYGKHLLDGKARLSSNFVGISVLIALTGGAAWLATQSEPWQAVFFFGLTMMIPLGTMLLPERRAAVLVAYTIGMALIGVAAIATAFISGTLFNAYTGVYMVALFIYQWVANAMMIKQSNR
ncbi:hypothetical protein EGT74_15605 [Chitinophaga lutea]|uniref:Uncharacterized protein n=1 Tax=Chitinophaga lutea TaxID=2488634 RepID=A0A3N4PXT2_9BACT|nr:tetratricopeptide repeat protein [Chitinophaga lutea]RPE08470.1 hypothetical protein EGT74_15605 [Chitinophaga lutea]